MVILLPRVHRLKGVVDFLLLFLRQRRVHVLDWRLPVAFHSFLTQTGQLHPRNVWRAAARSELLEACLVGRRTDRGHVEVSAQSAHRTPHRLLTPATALNKFDVAKPRQEGEGHTSGDSSGVTAALGTCISRGPRAGVIGSSDMRIWICRDTGGTGIK